MHKSKNRNTILLTFILAAFSTASCNDKKNVIAAPSESISGAPQETNKNYVTIEKYDVNRKKYCLIKITISEEFFISPNCNDKNLIAIDDDKNQRLLDYYQHNENIYFVFHLGDYAKKTEEQRKVSLIKFDSEKNDLKKIATKINISEFDNIFHSSPYKGGSLICATNKCYKIIHDKQELIELTPAGESDSYITEMSLSDDRIIAILKNPRNDYFSLASFINNSLTVSRISNDCNIPYELNTTDSQVYYKCVTTGSKEEYTNLLNNELKKLQKIQKRNNSVTNNDGRIVWEQNDYLPGLTKILSNEKLSGMIESEINDTTRKLTDDEIKNLVNISRHDKFLNSRRYSYSGNQISFAIHNFIFLKMAHELDILHLNPQITDSLGNFNNTTEELKYTEFNNQYIQALFFKKGSDFWADGINTPYNFSSSVALGLLHRKKNTADIKLATDLLNPLLQNEFPLQDTGWKYWWGIGKRGWQENDNYSQNTKKYQGHDAIANISYLTIDAEAILKLSQYSNSSNIHLATKEIENLISECKLPLHLMPQVKAECQKTNFAISHASEYKEFFYLISQKLNQD